MSAQLDPERVTFLFMNCLFRPGEDTRRGITVRCIGAHVTFHPRRLEEHKGEIAALLTELPEQHRYAIQDWSFLYACFDKHGNQWTSIYGIVEQLYLLGMAIGKVQIVVPRESWGPFPGNMPFLTVSPFA